MKVDAPETQLGFDRLFSMGRFLLVLGLLIFVSYPGLILGTRAFSYRDAGLFSYPVAYYLRDSLRAGQLPFWNPYIHCGIPFLAQWNTLTLYPLSLIYILLPVPWSVNVFLLGHLLIGGAGMYTLAHRWFGMRFAASVAGLVFAWNGMTIHCLMWPCHTAGLAWMPWVVWLGGRAVREGKRAIYLAPLLGAAQMLTGSPETILLTWLIILAAFGLDVLRAAVRFRSGAGRLTWVIILTSALSGAQLLPWFELLMHGDRTTATGSGFWALAPLGLANFFVPLFHLSPSLSGVFMQDEQQWTSSYYVGILPLVLTLIAVWRARTGRTFLLAGLAILGILLALADAGLVLNVLKWIVPVLGFIRFPIKFLILTVFCVALLAGAGTAWLQSQAAVAARKALFLPSMGVGLVILLILAAERWLPFPSDSWSAVWPNALARLAFLSGGLILLTQILRTEATQTRSILSFVFLLLMGLDICTHVPQQNPTVPAQAYGSLTPAMTPVPRLGESRAMLSPQAESTMDHLVNPDLQELYLGQRAELFSDCNLLDHIPKLGGFMTLHLIDENKVAGLLRSGKAAPGLAQFLSVSQIAAPKQLFVWEPQTNFIAWASIGQKPVFLDNDGILNALCDEAFSPREIVYLPLAAGRQIVAQADPQARVLSSHIEVSECHFETSAEKRTMLVVSQASYPCWRATIDGVQVPLFQANGAFQALEIPPGRHEIRMKYVDRMFQIGAGFAALALVFCFTMLAKSKPGKGFQQSPDF